MENMKRPRASRGTTTASVTNTTTHIDRDSRLKEAAGSKDSSMEHSEARHNADTPAWDHPTQKNNDSPTPLLVSTSPMDRPTASPKPNPFRDRLNASGTSKNAVGTPDSTKAQGHHCDFDQYFPDQSPTTAYVERRKSEIAHSLPAVDGNGNESTTPRLTRRGSKIPRMSPKAAAVGTSSDGSAENKRRPHSFTPGTKSALPIPSRVLHKNGESVKDAHLTADDARQDKNAEEIHQDMARASESRNGKVDSAEGLPQTNTVRVVQPDDDAAKAEEADNVTILPDGVKVKRLTDRSNGPVLRIAPDADGIIMGKEDAERDTRRSSTNKETRLSTDSFVSALSMRRNSRASVRAASQTTEANAGPTEWKTGSKANGAEGISPAPSSIPRRNSKPSPSKDLLTTPTKKSTNPFLPVDENETTPEPSGSEKKPGAKSNNVKLSVTTGKPLPKLVPRESGRVRVSDGSPRKNFPRRAAATTDNTEQADANSPMHGQRSPPNQSRASRLYEERNTPYRATTNRANAAATVPAVETHLSDEYPARENPNLPQKGLRPSITGDFKTAEKPPKPRLSTSGRGVFQNVRGFFAKHKADASKSSTNIPLPGSKLKSPMSAKSKAPAKGVAAPTTPSDMLNHLPSQRFYSPANEDVQSQVALQPTAHTLRPAPSTSRLSENPAMADTSSVSNLTMELLEAARFERETSKKEKLIRMGKVLIQAVNHSHDAEKSMLNAIQAAKEAEVFCAMAKENTVKLGQVVQEWTAEELRR